MGDPQFCMQCGMHTQPKEFHPYAACLMFLTCKDSRVVRANLKDLVAYNDEAFRESIRTFLEGREKAGTHNRDCSEKAIKSPRERDRLQGMAEARENDCRMLRRILEQR